MERKFYPEDFERFLKGHADQFRMTPSKKVWHGIYNDLHPGRRWPSIGMSIVFIFTLVIIGHLNTNNGNNNKSLQDMAALQNANQTKTTKRSLSAVKQIKTSDSKYIIAGHNSNEIVNTDSDPEATTPLLSVITDNEPSSNLQLGINTITNIPEARSSNIIENKNELSSDKVVNKIDLAGVTDKSIQENLNEIKTNNEELAILVSTVNEETNLSDNESGSKESTINLSPEINRVKINKPRRISNIAWTYYITPSLAYRSLSDKEINNAVVHRSMMGYEAGFAMSANRFKKLQFTAGLQLNYSGYIVRANSVHPTFASLLLTDESTGQDMVYSTTSHYGNKTGTEYTKLKNYSVQASMPIGLQYALGGNDNITFNIAASLQPTYVIASQAYLLSTNQRNYLTNDNLFRKWNLNSNLSPYFSFSSNSFNWQIGPQVRYQFLSTYTKQYGVKEHLINYGIRIGISNISK